MPEDKPSEDAALEVLKGAFLADLDGIPDGDLSDEDFDRFPEALRWKMLEAISCGLPEVSFTISTREMFSSAPVDVSELE